MSRHRIRERSLSALATVAGFGAWSMGCGTGKASLMFARRGLAVVGVEQSPQTAAVARVIDDNGGRFDFAYRTVVLLTRPTV